jgi:hypothetical protein
LNPTANPQSASPTATSGLPVEASTHLAKQPENHNWYLHISLFKQPMEIKLGFKLDYTCLIVKGALAALI